MILFLSILSTEKNKPTLVQQLYNTLVLIYCILGLFYNVSYLYTITSFLNTNPNVIYLLIFIQIYAVNKQRYLQCVAFFTQSIIFMCCSAFFSTNQQTPTDIFTSQIASLNINLLNGILLLHPTALYCFYAFTFVSFLLLSISVHLFRLKFLLKKPFLIKILLLYSIPLLLGCFWAEQELLWGGWWSWDFIELLALNMLVFILFLLHNKTRYPTNLYLFCFLLLFILSTILVRFNVVNSIHNFILMETQQQYSMYICLVVVFVFFCFFLQKNKLFKRNIFYLIQCCIMVYCLIQTVFMFNSFFFLPKINPRLIFIYFLLFLSCYFIIYVIVCVHVLMLLSFTCSFFDFLLFYFLLCALLLNFFKKNNATHLTVVYLCVYTMHGINVFKTPTMLLNNITNIKYNNLYMLQTNCVWDNSIFKDQVDINIDGIVTTESQASIFVDIFDKCILVGKLTIEQHSYDLQQLYQIHGFVGLVYVCFMLLLILLYLLYFKKST